MFEGIEIFYQRIANSMIETLPDEWIVAIFEAAFFDGRSLYEAEYTRKIDGKSRSFLPSDDGDAAFRDLRAAFIIAGKHPWGRARFELTSDGTFNLSFGYDDCDDQGFAIFDEDREREKDRLRWNRLTQVS